MNGEWKSTMANENSKHGTTVAKWIFSAARLMISLRLMEEEYYTHKKTTSEPYTITQANNL